jgi:predicted nucleic acid-binding protein
MSEVYILDACALIAILKDESGADNVAAIYEKANNGEVQLIMNKVNLFEVYYGFYRDNGRDYADNILNNVKRSALIISGFTDEIFMEAGRLKASYRISLADSILLAEAIVSGGTLLTADHHELDAVDNNGEIKFLWIR